MAAVYNPQTGNTEPISWVTLRTKSGSAKGDSVCAEEVVSQRSIDALVEVQRKQADSRADRISRMTIMQSYLTGVLDILVPSA